MKSISEKKKIRDEGFPRPLILGVILILIFGAIFYNFIGDWVDKKYPLKADIYYVIEIVNIKPKIKVLEQDITKGTFFFRTPYINRKFVKKIVSCESDGDSQICNRKYGCKGGAGLFGIIEMTWNESIVKMSEAEKFMPERCWQFIDYSQISKTKTERNEPVFDSVCNTLVGLWLFQTKGTAPWGYKGADWGSYECWKDYIN